MQRQTADGKVLLHFTMSRDGFVADPNHAMAWMAGTSSRPALIEEYAIYHRQVLPSRQAAANHKRKGAPC